MPVSARSSRDASLSILVPEPRHQGSCFSLGGFEGVVYPRKLAWRPENLAIFLLFGISAVFKATIGPLVEVDARFAIRTFNRFD